MGIRYIWVCSNDRCQNKLPAVSGGYDREFQAVTQTRICSSCKDVKDYIVGDASDIQNYWSSSESKHKLTFSEISSDIIENGVDKSPEIECSNCGGKTIPWSRTCPKCGSLMVAGDNDGLALVSRACSAAICLWDAEPMEK